MKNKIVFFDIDGTLVDEKKNIPELTKQAIHQLKENGVHVAIATGRPSFMYEDIREELDIQTYISFSGQHAVLNGETIYQHPVDRHQMIRLYEAAKQNEHPMVFMSDTAMRATTKNHRYIKESLGQLKFDYPKVDVDFPMNETIFQALLFCKMDEENDFIKEHESFHFLRWHPFACDVLPAGGTKAIGVNKIMDALGLDHAHSYAIGDGRNDIEMLQEVGTGIAMGNSVEPLLEVADHVTDHVDHDGVVKALKAFNLI